MFKILENVSQLRNQTDNSFSTNNSSNKICILDIKIFPYSSVYLDVTEADLSCPI